MQKDFGPDGEKLLKLLDRFLERKLTPEQLRKKAHTLRSQILTRCNVKHEPATVAAAKEQYGDEGRIEVDDGAVVSRGKGADGAYVAAWVWVEDSE